MSLIDSTISGDVPQLTCGKRYAASDSSFLRVKLGAGIDCGVPIYRTGPLLPLSALFWRRGASKRP
jgi:hypothetical protein